MANKKQLPQNSAAGNSNGSMLRAAMYSGPLPTASELEKYEAALPGSAARIVAMAEKEQSHRHALEELI